METLKMFPSITRLFGTLIEARIKASMPECFILDMLETESHLLEWWERCADRYLVVFEDAEGAIRSFTKDMLGDALAPNRAIFDGRLKDALAEVCAVVELSFRGARSFKRIEQPPEQGQKAPDFECLIGIDSTELQPYCVEVKHFRAPVGILDLFGRHYQERTRHDPEILNRSIQISHYWDNTVDEVQEAEILACFNEVCSCDLPRDFTLTIKDGSDPIEIAIKVRVGSGVSLSRGLGADQPWGPFTKVERFSAHVLKKIQKGLKQLSYCPDQKGLLVLSIETADGAIDKALLIDLRGNVLQESSGEAEVVFLHHYHWVDYLITEGLSTRYRYSGASDPTRAER